jgi:hypothetical protein
LINSSYNAYSMLYRGQISLGLPVSKELIISQAEIRNRAVRKLALVLYHICLNTTTVQIARNDIKKIIRDELANGTSSPDRKRHLAHRGPNDPPGVKAIQGSGK